MESKMIVQEHQHQHTEPQLLTAQHLAAALSLSVAWVRKHTLMGLPHFKCGGACRYDRAEVLSYLKDRQEG